MFSGMLALLRGAPVYETVWEALEGGGPPPSILGPGGAAVASVLAAVATDPRKPPGPALVVAPGAQAATRLADDLRSLLAGTAMAVVAYPDALDSPDAAPTRERLVVLDALAGGKPIVAVATASACLEPLPSPADLAAATLTVRRGMTLPRDRLVAHLEEGGYQRAAMVTSPAEFAVRGGVVDLFPPDLDRPIRLELWGDDIDSLRWFDPVTQRGQEVLEQAVVRPARLGPPGGGNADRGGGDRGDADRGAADPAPSAAGVALPDYLPPEGLLVLVEPAEIQVVARSRIVTAALRRRSLAISTARPPEGAWREVRLPTSALEAHGGQTHLLAQMLGNLAAEGLRVVLASAQAGRLAGILGEAGADVALAERLDGPPSAGRVTAVPASLSRGFRLDAAGLAVVTDAEIVGWRRRRQRMRFLRDGERITSWAELRPGDLVVHLHHGIGRYRGLVRLTLDGAEREYLLLEYAGEDRLYVPTDQIGLVQRYIGAEGDQPKIHRLGGAEWDREKRRVKEAAREMAASLLSLYAARASSPGHAFAPDTPWQREMEAAFPYQETPHQRQAIEDVKRDMESPKPMDRLVAGDVGYGKTEVALRAAFKAVMDGKQVAVVVPTTILAQQHYSVFAERFAPYPVTVEHLSRFRSPAEQKLVLARTAEGAVDVLIGTHRLLGKDVRFRDLGLVIVDEEQRFGVAHKEHLKTLRRTVDVLTLTATPIPRTLHMALAGLRDLTVIETPPEARLPIHTEIRPADDTLIREAILRERARGGQVYVVHNRVESIERAARRIRHLIPEARVGVAHGRMPEERLEQVMLDFLGGRYDVLVCTTIVEIGLDIPQVNTIVIEDAHLLGLAQLYQLRGRVGRADRQAYCYLVYPPGIPLTPEAEQRLRAMAEFIELGSGLGLAMRDLEIRGAGNLLGPEQHGHVAAVGFDLYCRLLEEAIQEARGEIVEEARDPVLELGLDAYLPPSYVPDEPDRVACYRRLAAARTPEEVEAVAAEMVERFGDPPPPARALLGVVRLRVAARAAGVASITRQNGRFLLRLGSGGHLDETLQRRLAAALGRRGQVTPAGVAVRVADTAGLEEVLSLLGRISTASRQLP